MEKQNTSDLQQSYELLLRVAVRLLFWKENELSKFITRKAAEVRLKMEMD